MPLASSHCSGLGVAETSKELKKLREFMLLLLK